jgi:hypothetical protein
LPQSQMIVANPGRFPQASDANCSSNSDGAGRDAPGARRPSSPSLAVRRRRPGQACPGRAPTGRSTRRTSSSNSSTNSSSPACDRSTCRNRPASLPVLPPTWRHLQNRAISSYTRLTHRAILPLTRLAPHQRFVRIARQTRRVPRGEPPITSPAVLPSRSGPAQRRSA